MKRNHFLLFSTACERSDRPDKHKINKTTKGEQMDTKKACKRKSKMHAKNIMDFMRKKRGGKNLYLFVYMYMDQKNLYFLCNLYMFLKCLYIIH